jgi:hypothetical protein
MQREDSGLHPSWRFRHTLKPTNSQNLALESAENKIYYVQSRNVYENNQVYDNTPEKSRTFSTKFRTFLSNRHEFCSKSGLGKGNLPLKAGIGGFILVPDSCLLTPC